ncbi:UvrD-helicase domain-containing protein [Hymenobacter sp. BT491]|uniref:UvrD-helicase domain-containing protein n=1 Tax=Hymenobacter sp. BT491 TaxID=2766779 RepID=UPI0016534688|nr:UvrD-helicase domain-containing protein [Hymenobacter sp. BT491]MBC6992240.1 UvrD-helicase domain-containing protein [Hymenobacter sp. BT491]
MRSILLAVVLLLSTPISTCLAQVPNATEAAPKAAHVFLCKGKHSHVYHYNRACRGLQTCSTALKETTVAQARRAGRRACRLASCAKPAPAPAATVPPASPPPASSPALTYLPWSVLALLGGYGVHRKQVATRHRLARTTALRVWLLDIEQAVAIFQAHTTFTTGYFEHAKLAAWQAHYGPAFAAVEGVAYQKTDLSAVQKATLQSFLDRYRCGEELRVAYNAEFIPQELQRYDALFSRVEGRSLDQQQRTAIVRNEDHSLVVAGAGSGKTTTIVGKVQYVLARYRTPPANILLISFTNQSAATLAARLGIPGLEPKTFHKFGKDLIAAVEGQQPALYDDSQFGTFLRTTFQELMRTSAYAEQVTTYFQHYLKPVKSSEEFKDQGAYIQHLKDHNFRAYKTVGKTVNGKLTYKQEVVKSVEECAIANFLLFHGVDYHYEAPYPHDTASVQHAQWKPDFTIVQGDKRVYLEHFGVDREGNVPAFFAQPGQSRDAATRQYQSKMAWARRTSRAHGTPLLETYSYQMQEHTLFAHLKAQLTQQGIVLRPKTPAEIWAIISAAAAEEVKSFTTLLQTFITLLKSDDVSVDDLRKKNDAIGNERERERNQRFLDVVAPLYARYQQHLHNRREIDFSDLINQATGYLTAGAYRKPFDYIIIDEFQDISQGRYRLIKALLAQNPTCKLFCVGDDWQSIYRFAGSDLALFNRFQQHFGVSVTAKIETTYRFHEPLISQSGAFITQNPTQVRKKLKSARDGKRTEHRIVYSASEEQDDTGTLQQILDELIATVPDLAQKELLLLGRYSFDLKRIKNTARIFSIDPASQTLAYSYQDRHCMRHTLHLPFLTVHKAKGLEADLVILLNCNAGKFGFPAQLSDDQVLSLVLSEADAYENGEERRLFYVALTRAKEQVILVTDPARKSKFINELEGKAPLRALKKCPVCVTADLVKRCGTTKGTPWAFYGCTNYAYGCSFRERIPLEAAQLN